MCAFVCSLNLFVCLPSRVYISRKFFFKFFVSPPCHLLLPPLPLLPLLLLLGQQVVAAWVVPLQHQQLQLLQEEQEEWEWEQESTTTTTTTARQRSTSLLVVSSCIRSLSTTSTSMCWCCGLEALTSPSTTRALSCCSSLTLPCSTTPKCKCSSCDRSPWTTGMTFRYV